ncbi:hypothetical protein [Calderihabitans maritimus]|nr:hypothetical protein [Calderihabitans maritimus]
MKEAMGMLKGNNSLTGELLRAKKEERKLEERQATLSLRMDNFL